MKKKRIIPFSWLPASWGLGGPAREEAEAYYYLDGFELDQRLAEIKYEGVERARAIVKAEFKHGIVDENTFNLNMAKLISDPLESEVAMLEARRAAGELSDKDAEKAIATAKKEPWVSVIRDGLTIEEGPEGYWFEFDWNEYWIEGLKEAGYYGVNDTEIIEAWFTQLCHSHTLAHGEPNFDIPIQKIEK